MRFQFQMEGLLRIRRLLEQQARERLDESMMRIRTFEQSLGEAMQWSQRTAAICLSEKLLPAIELQFIESVLRQTREAIAQCERKKQQEDCRADVLRAAYLLARRGRKTVETLRENAVRQFQVEQARREQSNLDEMYLGKLLHSRNKERPNNIGSAPESNL